MSDSSRLSQQHNSGCRNTGQKTYVWGRAIGNRWTSHVTPLGEQTHAPPCAIGETDRYGVNTPQDESFLTWLGDVTISNGMTTDTYGHTDLTTAIL